MGSKTKYSGEVRERAVRLVFEQQREHASQWAAIQSVAGKLGCTAETLRRWVRQAERDTGQRAGVTTSERDRMKAPVISRRKGAGYFRRNGASERGHPGGSSLSVLGAVGNP